jgi:hypothetical protein
MLYWKLARGNMGEDRASGDNILYNWRDCIYFGLELNPQVATDIVRLNSFNADKFICVHREASGYNNCKSEYL